MIIGIDASRATAARRTGTEAYAYHLIQGLIPAAAARGHRLRLYFNSPPDPDLFPDHPSVEPVVAPFRRLWTHVRLRQELRRRPPDLFFTPAHVIPVGYRRPSVATIHDLGYYHFPGAHTRWQRRYLRWSTRHNARASRRIIADSAATKADLVRLYGVDPGRIDVVYPGLDAGLGPVTDEAVLTAVQQKYGITPPYLVYIGTLQPRKNLVRLVHAYADYAVATAEPYRLVLAGQAGWLSDPILDAITSYPTAVTKLISLTGFVDEEDKAALLSGATALLFPSLYEGFGLPVLEAQACGTPVLCANTSSLPEVAGDAALLVDPLDTAAITAGIRQLVADGALRQALVERGKVNAGRFSWTTAVNQVLATLEAAV